MSGGVCVRRGNSPRGGEHQLRGHVDSDVGWKLRIWWHTLFMGCRGWKDPWEGTLLFCSGCLLYHSLVLAWWCDGRGPCSHWLQLLLSCLG